MRFYCGMLRQLRGLRGWFGIPWEEARGGDGDA